MNLNRLNKIVKNIIKEHFSSENEYKNLENYLLDNIDTSDYDVVGENTFQAVYDIFKSEKGYDIKRYGIKKSFEDWLRGLPSVLSSLPTYYNEIYNLLYALGFNEVKNMGNDEIDKLFYNSVTEIILNNVNTETHALTELESRLIKKLKK